MLSCLWSVSLNKTFPSFLHLQFCFALKGWLGPSTFLVVNVMKIPNSRKIVWKHTITITKYSWCISFDLHIHTTVIVNLLLAGSTTFWTNKQSNKACKSSFINNAGLTTCDYVTHTSLPAFQVTPRSSQCSTTGLTKAVVCAILCVGWCI